MRRVGAAAIAALAATALFASPISADPGTHKPTTSGGQSTTTHGPTVSAGASGHTPPAAGATNASPVSDAAKGLGQTISAVAKGAGGQPDTSAIHDAVDAHKTAVQDAAHDRANGGSSATDGSAPANDVAAGNSEAARGHGEQVSALARTGVGGEAVSALAKTLGELVRDGALSIGDGGQHVSSADDPDIALDSGVAADDDAGADSASLREPSATQLTA